MLAAMRQLLPVLAALLPALGWTPGTALAQPVAADYVVRWVGVEIGRVQTELRRDDETYHLAYRSWTSGPLRWIVDLRSDGWAAGRMAGQGRPQVEHFRGRSSSNHGESAWQVSFDAEGRVTALDVDDATRSDREPVPPTLQTAPDPMTLMFKTMFEVAEGGSFTATSFDGRRAMRYVMTCEREHTPIQPIALAAAGGTALVCDADGELTAGRSQRWGSLTDDEPSEREPVRIWFAPGLGDMPYWPVRAEATSRYGRIAVELAAFSEHAG